MREQWLAIAASPPERREGPLVVVQLGLDIWPTKQRIVELGRRMGWRILDLDFYGGFPPPGPPPRGAFLQRLPSDPLVRALRKRGCHVVRLGNLPHPQDKSVPAIIEDRAVAGRVAAEHFAERRFRHVGFVGYAPMTDVMPMFKGLRSRAAELGCECHLLAFGTLDDGALRLATEEKLHLRLGEFAEWIVRVPKPIGVLTIHDRLAGRLSAAALEAGLAVPLQVAVLGHGNVEALCESAPVPLSSVDPGGELQAEAAVRLMQDLLAGKPRPARALRVPPRGIAVRASTDVLAAADPDVARTIRYLWDHLEKNLSVADVAAVVAMPRRKLERMFHDHIGHGINAELNRRRLERCCELLRTTKLPIADIAPRVGFRSKDYLHALFRRRFGTTPRKYRLSRMRKNALAGSALQAG